MHDVGTSCQRPESPSDGEGPKLPRYCNSFEGCQVEFSNWGASFFGDAFFGAVYLPFVKVEGFCRFGGVGEENLRVVSYLFWVLFRRAKTYKTVDCNGDRKDEIKNE